MPLKVSMEPIHAIIPRYIIRMHVAMSGAKASPNTAVKFVPAVMPVCCIRNQYALKNVKMRRATPIKSSINPTVSVLFFICIPLGFGRINIKKLLYYQTLFKVINEFLL